MFHVSAPGKQMLAGEWAVLDVGNPCIVAAVNKRVHCTIEGMGREKTIPEHSIISITIDDFNIKNIIAHFDGSRLLFKELTAHEKEKLQFFKEAIEVTMKYLSESLDELKDFKIHSWGEMSQLSVDGQEKKIGFGSSAAATVAVTAAILSHHGFEIDKMKEEIYKLSSIAHYFAQGKVGSAFDIASSTYGGLLSYKRFDPTWLLNELQRDTIKGVVEKKWASLHLEELKIPKDFILLVGWTKGSASTSAMIKQMDAFKTSQKEEYNEIISSIGELVSDLIKSVKKNDQEKICELLRENENLLSKLTKASGVSIETEDLRKLSILADKAGAAGKLSGAGGGDCGIAVCFDEEIAEEVKKAWSENDFYPLDVEIDHNGVKIED